MKRQLDTCTGSMVITGLEDANKNVIGIEEATIGLVLCFTAQSHTGKWLLARSNGDNLEDLLCLCLVSDQVTIIISRNSTY